jgi:catechol 2,3-dioxygenase-like lactoylglutathione lyase family enzyme
MSFKLHFLGISAADWQAAHRFYNEQLGITTAELNPSYGNWALMGRSHAACRATPNVMKFELFDSGNAPEGGWEWGRTQGARPSIYVDDLQQAIRALEQRRIEFSSPIETTLWGQRIEFKAQDGLRWALEEAPQLVAGNSFQEPNIGSVSLKVYDLAAQKAFYQGVLGMQVLHEDERVMALQRQPGEPYLFLEAGGENGHVRYVLEDNQIWTNGAWVSFSVEDVEAAAARLRSAGVNIVHDITTHLDWQGKDMLICDPDGSIMQVVQYLYPY